MCTVTLDNSSNRETSSLIGDFFNSIGQSATTLTPRPLSAKASIPDIWLGAAPCIYEYTP